MTQVATHSRGRWFHVGNPYLGRQYSLGCVCGWRSRFSSHQYQAEWALREHLETQAEEQQ